MHDRYQATANSTTEYPSHRLLFHFHLVEHPPHALPSFTAFFLHPHFLSVRLTFFKHPLPTTTPPPPPSRPIDHEPSAPLNKSYLSLRYMLHENTAADSSQTSSPLSLIPLPSRASELLVCIPTMRLLESPEQGCARTRSAAITLDGPFDFPKLFRKFSAAASLVLSNRPCTVGNKI